MISEQDHMDFLSLPPKLYNSIEENVVDLLVHLKIHRYPVDTIDIARKLGYELISFSKSVTIPITNKTILINHTHPGGTASPSSKDLKMMELLSQIGSPQKTFGIVPVGKTPVQFTKKGMKR